MSLGNNKNMNLGETKKLITITALVALVVVGLAVRSLAFNGPSSSGGTGGGFIGIGASGNVSVGTSTPLGTVMLLTMGSTTNSSYYAFEAQNSNGSPLFVVRNDGNVGVGTSSPAYSLSVSGTVNAVSYCISGANCITSWPSSGGSGTVTSITAGNGLTGGTITGSGTIAVSYGSSTNTAVQGNTSITITAGSGMSGGGSITLGAGGSVTLTNAISNAYDSNSPAGYYATYAP